MRSPPLEVSERTADEFELLSGAAQGDRYQVGDQLTRSVDVGPAADFGLRA